MEFLFCFQTAISESVFKAALTLTVALSGKYFNSEILIQSLFIDLQ